MAVEIKIDTVLTTHAEVSLSGAVNLDGSTTTPAPSTFQWVLLSQPEGSSESLTGGTTATPTFTANTEGAYLIQLIVDEGTANEAIGSAVVSVNTLKKDLIIPAAGEKLQFGAAGWQLKLERLFKVTAEAGSRKTLTVGSLEGADFSSVSTATDSLTSLGVDSERVVIKMLEDYTETGVVIPSNIILDGGGHKFSSSATVDIQGGWLQNFDMTDVSSTAVTVSDYTGSGDAGEEAVILNILDRSTSSASTISIGSGAHTVYIFDVQNVDLTVNAAYTGNTQVITSSFGTITLIQGNLDFKSCSWTTLNMGPEVDAAMDLAISNSIGDINVVSGTGGVVSASLSIGPHSGSITGAGLTTTTVSLTQESEFVGYDNGSSGLAAVNVQAAIDEVNSKVVAATGVLRDTIEFPAGLAANTDITLTNTSYTTGAVTAPDFSQLRITLDGLFLTVSENNNNSDLMDSFPGSDGSNIKLATPITSGGIVQVLR